MVKKIISGGQAGVDRAALDLALYNGIPCGGACPRGRWAEDGCIDPRYPLTEVSSVNPAIRTLANVSEADATLIIVNGKVGRGSAATVAFARRLARPVLVVNLAHGYNREEIRSWLSCNAVEVLNVAGSRASSSPGIYDKAVHLLAAVLLPWGH